MEELEKALWGVFKQSQLPLEAKRYVLKHLFIKVDLQYKMLELQAERENANDVGGADGENR